jgi:protein Mpv17
MRRLNFTGITKTFAKLFFDRVIFGPPMVLLTVTFLQFFQTFSISKTWKQIQTTFWPVLVMNESVWTIAQAVNFELVPVPLQVLFVNAVAIGYNTLLSLSS